MMPESTAPATVPHTVADDLARAARQLVPGALSQTPITASRRILRVDTAAGSVAVTEWPAEASRERIAFVHNLRQRLTRAGIGLLPPALPLPADPGSTVLALGGRFFEARPWLPGVPLGHPLLPPAPPSEPIDLPATAPLPILLALVETVARIHGTLPAPPQPPASQMLTLASLEAATRQYWQAFRASLRPVAPAQPAVQRWLRVGERVLPAARTLLEQQPALAQQSTVAGHHRLWPAHVLIRSEAGNARMSGLLGFSDPAWGSPLLDLAQIATRFARWSPEIAEDVIGAYAAVRPLSPDERRLLPAVAALDLVIQAGRLLDLAVGSEQTAAAVSPRSPLTAAAESLVASLEAISGALLPPAKRRSRRNWTLSRSRRDRLA